MEPGGNFNYRARLDRHIGIGRWVFSFFSLPENGHLEARKVCFSSFVLRSQLSRALPELFASAFHLSASNYSDDCPWDSVLRAPW